MGVPEAKQEIIDKSSELGFTIEEETASGFHLIIENNKVIITNEDIHEYQIFLNSKLDYHQTPVECSICSTNYREQVLISIEPTRFRPWMMPFRDSEHVFGVISEDNVYATIGESTTLFANFFRFDPELVRMSQRRRNLANQREITWDELIRKPLTIKVYNLNDTTIQKAVNKSSKIIEDCLFELSYMKDYSLWLSDNWPYVTRRSLRFSLIPRFRGKNFPLSVHYNSDLIRLYQYAQSTVVPEAKFLAYYQILEYFFISISNENLYEKLKNRMKDPRFNLSNKNLESVYNDVRLHRRVSDETKMLQNVLDKFILKKDLIDFINKYESHLKTKIYSNKHNVFGKKGITVILKEEHVLSKIAVHIKEVRNAIVHSSDRYEGNTRHIPFSKTTKLIEQDIPLLKYLAERTILASATSSSIYNHTFKSP